MVVGAIAVAKAAVVDVAGAVADPKAALVFDMSRERTASN